jgi:hypothetical protein
MSLQDLRSSCHRRTYLVAHKLLPEGVSSTTKHQVRPPEPERLVVERTQSDVGVEAALLEITWEKASDPARLSMIPCCTWIGTEAMYEDNPESVSAASRATVRH